MSRFKIFAFIALITFAFGIVLVGDALAGERGKVIGHHAAVMTTSHTLKVPDVEDHTILLFEDKGIAFSDKWGIYKFYEVGVLDIIKGANSCQGYFCATFPDGSTYTNTYKGNGPVGENEGTYTYTKGTGKLEGIQGGGTWKAHGLAPGQWYVDWQGEYRLP